MCQKQGTGSLLPLCLNFSCIGIAGCQWRDRASSLSCRTLKLIVLNTDVWQKIVEAYASADICSTWRRAPGFAHVPCKVRPCSTPSWMTKNLRTIIGDVVLSIACWKRALSWNSCRSCRHNYSVICCSMAVIGQGILPCVRSSWAETSAWKNFSVVSFTAARRRFCRCKLSALIEDRIGVLCGQTQLFWDIFKARAPVLGGLVSSCYPQSWLRSSHIQVTPAITIFYAGLSAENLSKVLLDIIPSSQFFRACFEAWYICHADSNCGTIDMMWEISPGIRLSRLINLDGFHVSNELDSCAGTKGQFRRCGLVSWSSTSLAALLWTKLAPTGTHTIRCPMQLSSVLLTSAFKVEPRAYQIWDGSFKKSSRPTTQEKFLEIHNPKSFMSHLEGQLFGTDDIARAVQSLYLCTSV